MQTQDAERFAFPHYVLRTPEVLCLRPTRIFGERTRDLSQPSRSHVQSRNALDTALIAEITRCFGELAEDDDVRVVVLTGEGSVFCAGADIGYMRDTAGF